MDSDNTSTRRIGRPSRQVALTCRTCQASFSVNARRAELGAYYCSLACHHKQRRTYDVYKGAGVYVVKHLPSGRVYVGSSANCAQRWRQHLSDLRAGDHHAPTMREAWLSDGESSLKMIVLARIENPEERLGLEAYYIKLFRSTDPRFGFNLYLDGHSARGYKARSESRARMSAAQQGVKSVHAKLTEDQVREVRRMRKDGVSLTAISKRFSVNYEIIQGICAGKRYRNAV